MESALKIALWNANGLAQHSQELKLFIQNHDLDILLISETHFTNKSFFSLPRHTIYNTNHPDEAAHGGTAIIIKNNIQHYEMEKYEKN